MRDTSTVPFRSRAHLKPLDKAVDGLDRRRVLSRPRDARRRRDADVHRKHVVAQRWPALDDDLLRWSGVVEIC